MWTYLDERFGSSRKVIDSIIHDIKTLKKCHDEDPESTVKFIRIIEKANQDVNILKFDSHLNNNVIVGEIDAIFVNNK